MSAVMAIIGVPMPASADLGPILGGGWSMPPPGAGSSSSPADRHRRADPPQRDPARDAPQPGLSPSPDRPRRWLSPGLAGAPVYGSRARPAARRLRRVEVIVPGLIGLATLAVLRSARPRPTTRDRPAAVRQPRRPASATPPRHHLRVRAGCCCSRSTSRWCAARADGHRPLLAPQGLGAMIAMLIAGRRGTAGRCRAVRPGRARHRRASRLLGGPIQLGRADTSGTGCSAAEPFLMGIGMGVTHPRRPSGRDAEALRRDGSPARARRSTSTAAGRARRSVPRCCRCCRPISRRSRLRRRRRREASAGALPPTCASGRARHGRGVRRDVLVRAALRRGAFVVAIEAAPEGEARAGRRWPRTPRSRPTWCWSRITPCRNVRTARMRRRSSSPAADRAWRRST